MVLSMSPRQLEAGSKLKGACQEGEVQQTHQLFGSGAVSVCALSAGPAERACVSCSIETLLFPMLCLVK